MMKSLLSMSATLLLLVLGVVVVPAQSSALLVGGEEAAGAESDAFGITIENRRRRLVGISSSHSVCDDQQHWTDHPILCHWLDYAADNLEEFARLAHDWAASVGFLVDLRRHQQKNDVLVGAAAETVAKEERQLLPQQHVRRTASSNQQQLPVVMAHGMGDSCFNGGMQHITKYVSTLLDDVYTVCIPTGDSQGEDTKNGYFMNMDDNVAIFAAKVRADPNLANGFHAIGFSQGNNVIRGYIAHYNEPAVDTFISINGVNAGIGAVPYCRPTIGSPSEASVLSSGQEMEEKGNDDDAAVFFSMCDLLMEQASRSAYTEFSQKHSFQANYWRDPRPSAADLYHEYGQLAVWNNEIPGALNHTLNENWAKTRQFVWVLATEDGMVWPREGEQFGCPDPQDPFHTIKPMAECDWYQHDLFGLKAADAAGKMHFESFVGDHLQFEQEDFDRWVKTYLINK